MRDPLRRRPLPLLLRGLRVFDGGRADGAGGLHPSLRRSRDEDPRKQLGRKRWRQLQLFDLVELPFEGDRPRTGEQAPDDAGVFREPLVAPIVGGRVVESRQIVLEPARDHVQIDPPPVQVAEGGRHLGDGIRMHVDRLDRDQRAQGPGALDDDLRHQPGVDERVVRIDEDPPAPRPFAPAGHPDDLVEIGPRVVAARRRAGGEDLDAWVERGRSPLSFVSRPPLAGGRNPIGPRPRSRVPPRATCTAARWRAPCPPD